MNPLAWFRSNNGGGAWLAFFALACQLVLTFGHVHFAGSGVISAALTRPANPAVDGASAPVWPAHQPPAQDFCAVCNNIALANTFVLPESPDSLPPVLIASAGPRWPPTAVGPASQDHFHFSARGPPRSIPAT